MMRQLGANILIISLLTLHSCFWRQYWWGTIKCLVFLWFWCRKNKVVNILNYQPRIGRVQGPSLSTENLLFLKQNMCTVHRFMLWFILWLRQWLRLWLLLCVCDCDRDCDCDCGCGRERDYGCDCDMNISHRPLRLAQKHMYLFLCKNTCC